MVTQSTTTRINVYGTDQQAFGQFPGTDIQGHKPIGFPGEGGSVNRLGPLFYLAWEGSEAGGLIGMHPHRGFEIISYMTQGQLEHRDSLGNMQIVGEGGAQVMQTGSGVSHSERLFPRTHFFQIWFEPNLAQAVREPATYRQLQDADFPRTQHDGVDIKHIAGRDAPVQFTTDAHMQDVYLPAGTTWPLPAEAGRTLALVVIDGEGSLGQHTLGHRDFVVVEAGDNPPPSLQAATGLRLLLIDVPTTVDYPLYRR